jgi:hypothetical protein
MRSEPPRYARFAALAAILCRTAVRRASPVAVPLYLAIAVVSSVLFGPNRMSAADACEALEASLAIRAVLWVGWLLLSLPVARSLLVVPESFWLRSLPLPAWWMWLVHAGLVAAAQAPWILLWSSGRGVTTGLAYGLTAAAANALLVPAPRPGRALLLAVTVAAPLLLAPAPALLGVAPVLLLFAVGEAWGRAPEVGGRGGSALAVFRGPRWVALSVASLVDLWRGDSSRLVRALVISCIGSGVIWLVIRNNHIAEPSGLVGAVLVVCSPTLVMSLTGIAGRCLSVERECRWLLDVTSTGAIHRIAAQCSAVSLVGLLLGGLIGSILVLSIRPGLGLVVSLRLFGAASIWGAAVGLLLSIAMRWGQLGGQVGGGRELGSVLAVLGGTTVSAAVWREASIPFTLTAAALLIALLSRLRPRMPAR